MDARAEPAAFERILEHLRQGRGFDFTAYKRPSLMRRITKRRHAVGIVSFDEYLDYLQVHPEEFAPLFNTILINVTSFFRDADVWDMLRENIAHIQQRDGTAIRVWSAGCAGGQEPYSAAMVLAELFGSEGFRERVKIYATDVDEDALREARLAIYDARQVVDVPEDLLTKYFARSGDRYTFDRDLRRAVIFGRHDLIQDAPISRVDLLLCRNTLMYFNAEAQARIMARFYFSVNPGGLLVLGRAEMLFSHTTMFQAIDLKRRIFKTVQRVSNRERLLLFAQTGREEIVMQDPNHTRLRELALDSGNDPQILLDGSGILVAANNAARREFGIGASDVGSPIQDFEFSYRPVELRGHLDRLHTERREIALPNVQWERDGITRFVSIVLKPLVEDNGGFAGVSIRFEDVTPVRRLQSELVQSKQELETAYEELQATNEELETTNEQLQSTVEELETTNEELQSTNEELETMNEELQSTNDELQTMNDELRNRSTELNSTNAFLEAVFSSLRHAVVVLDRDMRVQVWNPEASDLWGLRPDEVQGVYFFGLDIGLPVAELHQPTLDILNASADRREVSVNATNRKARPLICRVSVTPLRNTDAIAGAILLMEELKDAQPSLVPA
jgi:two-component system, chemotaxis family, CheB/CheR fusion protein